MSASNVSSITPHVRRLEAPTELRELPGWLCWRNEYIPGEDKALKVPYYANGQKRYGRQGSPTDRAKLVTFAAARDAAARRGYDGVGLALMPEWGITALDFDHCVGPDGSLPPEVEAIVGKTYAEYSPSGRGVRAFVKGALGNRKSIKGGQNAFGFEVFSSSGFVTFTGNTLPFTEALALDDYIAPVDDDVVRLATKRFGSLRPDTEGGGDFLDTYEPPLGLSEAEVLGYLSDLDPSMGREGWIHVGMALHHELGAEGFYLWDEWSSDGVQYPGTDALKTQWDSFDRRSPGGRQITMRTVKKMSADARAERGQPPRGSEMLEEAVKAAQAAEADSDPSRLASSPDWDGRFVIHAAGDFAERPPVEWMVKGVVPEQADVVVVYGASGSGKSFIVLDMALAVARGVPWRERKVRQKRVLYIAAEGGGGVAQRLRAYSHHNVVALKGLPFGVIHDAPNFMIADDVAALIKAITDAGGADLIIVDTLAQVTPGANENSGEDMGIALKHARSLRKATGAVIMLVAHTGKDQAKGIRGWSGLNAAADTSLEVFRPEEGDVRLLKVTKQKDGRDDLAWGFKLESVLLGIDSDGEEITSLVVVESDPPAPPAPEPKVVRKIGAWERVVLDHLESLGTAFVEMPLSELIDQVVPLTPEPADGERDLRRQNIQRAIKSLSRGPDAPLLLENGVVMFGEMNIFD
jgi:hypothetical protein